MAITRAQQAKQMLREGGRIGFKGGADMGTVSARDSKGNVTRAATARSVNISPTGGVTTSRDAPAAPTTFIGGQEIDVIPENRDQRELLELQAAQKRQKEVNQFINRPPDPINTPFPIINAGLNAAQKFLPYKINRKFYAENVIGKTYIDEDGNVKTFGLDADSYDDYDRLRKEGIINPYGRELSDFERGTGPYEGQDEPIIVRDDDENNDGDGDGDGNTNREKGLAIRFMNRGGMPMDAPTEGGIMDLETGRQMYFLGKLVKKATRAVKKITKSPLGKIALGAAAFKFGPAIFGKGSFNPFLMSPDKGASFDFSGLGSILNKIGAVDLSGKLTGRGMIGGLLSLLPFLSDEEKQQLEMDRGVSIDPGYIRSKPYTFESQVGSGKGLGFNFADGGRIGYQEGSKEPVAKKTMPLLDMGGKEMDLREDGGFVPIGRMEKADDVPARLSKNEFVFTADAVRNAGDGDVDKGAEVMYNMMKNLESGGDVSEESQGLEGARRMFQTSKRLEEVL